uniref:Uncharacterized protein n=1 Tax=viral metagenome TaxID=1070528 RepID=A0A6M3XQD7_9ZZZZ
MKMDWLKKWRIQHGKHDFSCDQEYLKTVQKRMQSDPNTRNLKEGNVEFDSSGEELGVITVMRWFVAKNGNVTPYKTVAPNFFNPNAEGEFLGQKNDAWLGITLSKHKEAYESNRQAIREFHEKLTNTYEIPQNDVVYIVGPGPSLWGNGHYLATVKRGTVIGLNAVGKMFPRALTDYMTIDPAVNEDCWASLPRGVRVWAGIQANPAIQQMLDVRWLRGAQKTKFDDALKEEFPYLTSLFHGYSVSFPALHLAQKMGAKTVVFVGHDASWKTPKRIPHEQKIRDINGEKCYTIDQYFTAAKHLLGAIYFMLKNGVRVINATGEGLLAGTWRRPSVKIEQRKLFETIEELNHGY